jgi:hypothetical protein
MELSYRFFVENFVVVLLSMVYRDSKKQPSCSPPVNKTPCKLVATGKVSTE